VASSSMDFVYARVVLRYLARPDLALAEMARALRPGCRVFVLDTDDGTLVVEPDPPGFREVAAAKRETQRRRAADSFFARKLPALLAGAGLGGITGGSLPVSSLAIGPEAFATIILAPTTEAIDPDLLAEREVQAAKAAIRDWGRDPRSFGMMSAVLVSAE